MAGWTAPPSFTSHAILPSASLGIISNDLSFLGAVPVGEAYTLNGNTFVAASASPTQIAMDYAWNSGFMTYGSNEFTVPFTGRYHVFGQVIYTIGATGASYWGCQIRQNSTVIAIGQQNTATAMTLTVEAEYLFVCNAGDTISLWGVQDNSSSSYAATGTLGVFWVSN